MGGAGGKSRRWVVGQFGFRIKLTQHLASMQFARSDRVPCGAKSTHGRAVVVYFLSCSISFFMSSYPRW